MKRTSRLLAGSTVFTAVAMSAGVAVAQPATSTVSGKAARCFSAAQGRL